MFDDPKKDLKELEGQLLAAEHSQESAELDQDEFEALYDEILAEFGPKEPAVSAAASAPEPAIRNFANGYGRTAAPQPLGKDGDEILADDEPVPSRKGVKGLMILACLETLAIAAVAVYWFFQFL